MITLNNLAHLKYMLGYVLVCFLLQAYTNLLLSTRFLCSKNEFEGESGVTTVIREHHTMAKSDYMEDSNSMGTWDIHYIRNTMKLSISPYHIQDSA